MHPLFLLSAVVTACLVAATGPSVGSSRTPLAMAYRVQSGVVGRSELTSAFSDEQLATLEKLNRADREHLPKLPALVVPERWFSDELAYSAMPARYPAGESFPKMLVVHLPGQVFGAYQFGALVRWGPVGSGRRNTPTPAGLFSLNWKSRGHASSVNAEWFMRWYFNFGSRAGLALHAYALSGRPASHGCVRLLERDAEWLFGWGQEWMLDESGTRVLETGTPVYVVGAYDFDAPPPWRSPEWLVRPVELPPLPATERTT